jgi:hypothetical protein
MLRPISSLALRLAAPGIDGHAIGMYANSRSQSHPRGHRPCGPRRRRRNSDSTRALRSFRLGLGLHRTDQRRRPREPVRTRRARRRRPALIAVRVRRRVRLGRGNRRRRSFPVESPAARAAPAPPAARTRAGAARSAASRRHAHHTAYTTGAAMRQRRINTGRWGFETEICNTGSLDFTGVRISQILPLLKRKYEKGAAPAAREEPRNESDSRNDAADAESE